MAKRRRTPKWLAECFDVWREVCHWLGEYFTTPEVMFGLMRAFLALVLVFLFFQVAIIYLHHERSEEKQPEPESVPAVTE